MSYNNSIYSYTLGRQDILGKNIDTVTLKACSIQSDTITANKINGKTCGVHVGKVCGNLTGTTKGLHSGKVKGDLTGNTFGEHKGNVIGNLIGDVQGNVSGTFSGNVSGDISGNTIGIHIGEVEGDVTGDLIGNVTGDLLGKVVGDVFGDLTGNVMGELMGNVIGDVLGNLCGNLKGDMTGNLCGDMKGNLVCAKFVQASEIQEKVTTQGIVISGTELTGLIQSYTTVITVTPTANWTTLTLNSAYATKINNILTFSANLTGNPTAAVATTFDLEFSSAILANLPTTATDGMATTSVSDSGLFLGVPTTSTVSRLLTFSGTTTVFGSDINIHITGQIIIS